MGAQSGTSMAAAAVTLVTLLVISGHGVRWVMCGASVGDVWDVSG